MYTSLTSLVRTSIMGLALIASGCGSKTSKGGESITIEGKVYLVPEHLRSSEAQAGGPLTSSKKASINQTMQIQTEGDVTVYCSAGVTFDNLDCTKNPYISSATITKAGDYSVPVPREILETTGATVVATDKEGNYTTGMHIPNPLERELYPAALPEKLTGQDITKDREASTKVLYGAMQKIKDTVGSFNYDNLTEALGMGAKFFAIVPKYFKDLAIGTVEEYFNQAEMDTQHQREIGEAYKSTRTETEDSVALGSDLIQRGRGMDLSKGNVVEISEGDGEEKCSSRSPAGSEYLQTNYIEGCYKPCADAYNSCINPCVIGTLADNCPSDLKMICESYCNPQQCEVEPNCLPACREWADQCLIDCKEEITSCAKACCDAIGCRWVPSPPSGPLPLGSDGFCSTK